MTRTRACVLVLVIAVLGAASGGTPAGAVVAPPGSDFTVLFPQEWCGTHEFGTLTVADDLRVADSPNENCAATDVGTLTLEVARLVVQSDGRIQGSSGRLTVEATETITNVGRISADGVFLGDVTGSATPSGNGGAGHGGGGGLGVATPSIYRGGGSPYGLTDDGVTESGSRGGPGGGAGGGAGGGQIVLKAFDIANHGVISANGATGGAGAVIDCADETRRNPGAGGGSGGAIVMDAMRIRSTGVIAVAGGNGGAGAGGGGGGGGGIADLIAPVLAASVSTAGGLGGAGLCPVEFANFGSDGQGAGFEGADGPAATRRNAKSDLLPASNAPWFKGSAPVRLRAASSPDPLHVEVCRGASTSSCAVVNQFDFPPDTLVDQTITVGPLPSGVHGLWSRANGELPPAQPEVTVRIDIDPPAQPTVTSPSPTGNPNITLNVTGVSDALSGVARVECSNDSQAWTACGPPTNGPRPWTIGAGPGAHTVYVRVIDAVGNVSPSGTTTVVIDGSAPATTATVTPDVGTSGWYRSTPTVTLHATDTGGVASITYAVSGANAKPPTTVMGDTASFTLPADGISTVSYFATDTFGRDEPTHTLQLRIDKTAPTGVVGTAARPPDSNGWYNRPVAIAFSGNDPTSGIATCTSLTYSGPDTSGTTMPGSCTDQAGNRTDATFGPLKYDGTGPTTRISGAPIRISVGPTGMVGTVNDNVPTSARVVVTFAGLLNTVARTATCTSGCGTTAATWHVSTVGLIGLYTVTAQATDAAGNVGTTSNAVTAVIV